MVIADENRARRALEGIDYHLAAAVHAAWAGWVSKRYPEASPLTRANVMHDLMIAEAGRRLTHVPGVKLKVRAKRTLLCLPDGFVLQFKKLDDQRLPRNYPTRLAIAFSHQFFLPGLAPGQKRLTLGYRLNELGTELRDVSIVCAKGSKILYGWSLNEPTMQQGELIPFSPAPAPAAAHRRIKLKLIKKDDAEGGETR